MKTTLQLHIDSLSKWKGEMMNEVYQTPKTQVIIETIDKSIRLAEKMLDKEKEVIIETSKNSYIAGYLDNQAKVDDSMNFPEEYYNETFNTKEK